MPNSRLHAPLPQTKPIMTTDFSIRLIRRNRWSLGMIVLLVPGVAMALLGLAAAYGVLFLCILPAPCRNTLLRACALCITADQEATARQGGLLRVAAGSLGCPMPPLLPGMPLLGLDDASPRIIMESEP